jgi:hypothetical protein
VSPAGASLLHAATLWRSSRMCQVGWIFKGGPPWCPPWGPSRVLGSCAFTESQLQTRTARLGVRTFSWTPLYRHRHAQPVLRRTRSAERQLDAPLVGPPVVLVYDLDELMHADAVPGLIVVHLVLEATEGPYAGCVARGAGIPRNNRARKRSRPALTFPASRFAQLDSGSGRVDHATRPSRTPLWPRVVPTGRALAGSARGLA